VKYEDVYLRDYQDIQEVKEGLGRYFDLYNFERLHQSLDYNTPASAYYERREVRATA
jgi:putative transposase